MEYVPDTKVVLHDVEEEEKIVSFESPQWETGYCIWSHQHTSWYSAACSQKSAGKWWFKLLAFNYSKEMTSVCKKWVSIGKMVVEMFTIWAWLTFLNSSVRLFNTKSCLEETVSTIDLLLTSCSAGMVHDRGAFLAYSC
jgi:hypothetical protein